MSLHRRDDEEQSFEHLRVNDIPAWLRYFTYASDKIGVTAVVCFCMVYICFVSIRKMTESIDRLNSTLIIQAETMNSHYNEGREWRSKHDRETEQIYQALPRR